MGKDSEIYTPILQVVQEDKACILFEDRIAIFVFLNII